MNSSVNIAAPIERTPEETIAELARSVPKPNSRPEAFNALRRLVKDTANNEALDDNACDLARLWAFFLPKAAPRARSPFDWASKAIGKNDTRYYLNFVYVTEAEIIGTDGHSLHIAPNGGSILEPGYYGPEGVRLHGPDYARYPDVRRVQPDPHGRHRQWFDIQLEDLELATMSTQKAGVFNYYKLPTHRGYEYQERVYINAKLVKRLFSLDPDELVGINVGGPADSVLVKLPGRRTAVLMPLRQ